MYIIPQRKITEELSLPILGLGTWGMGGWRQPDTSEDKKWISSIETAIEHGITHIDTAAMYGDGHTERLVGEAIRNFDREKLFISTKVAGDKLQFADVIHSAEASCKRLKIKQIDLFLLHWPSNSVPLSQTISAVNHLLKEKKIRYFGLSNFPVKLIQEAELFSNSPVITNQIEYNLTTRNNGAYNRNIESEIIPYCLKKGISITAWRPVMKGKASELEHPLIEKLSKKYNKTTFQIALNWLLNKPMMLTIPKMSTQEHIIENIAATNFKMEDEDIKSLDALVPNK